MARAGNRYTPARFYRTFRSKDAETERTDADRQPGPVVVPVRVAVIPVVASPIRISVAVAIARPPIVPIAIVARAPMAVAPMPVTPMGPDVTAVPAVLRAQLRRLHSREALFRGARREGQCGGSDDHQGRDAGQDFGHGESLG